MDSTANRQNIPHIYTLDEIENVVSTSEFAIELIEAIQEGFVAYSQGKFNACPIQTMGAPPMAPFLATVDGDTVAKNYAAQTCVKSGYITSSSHYVIKVASGGHPFPSNSGLMQLYSQRTGKLETILLDEGLLTELRTAAVGAVAAKLLAPDLSNDNNDGETVQCIGILGTGIQARYQLRYLAHVTTCRHVLVYGRTKCNVESFVRDMDAEGWNVHPVEFPNDLLRETFIGGCSYYCPLVVTTTSSRESILLPMPGTNDDSNNSTDSMRKKQGIHITCIGSDSTGKMELSPHLISQADLLVADSRLQTNERGEFEEALKEEIISIDNVVELGELVLKKNLHRGSQRGGGNDCRFTIFDSSGVAVQDCVVAAMVHKMLSGE